MHPIYIGIITDQHAGSSNGTAELLMFILICAIMKRKSTNQYLCIPWEEKKGKIQIGRRWVEENKYRERGIKRSEMNRGRGRRIGNKSIGEGWEGREGTNLKKEEV